VGEECGDRVEMHGTVFPEFDGGAVPEVEEVEVECEGEGMDWDGDAEGKNSGNSEFFGETGESGMDNEEVEGKGSDDGKGWEDGKRADLSEGEEVGRDEDRKREAGLAGEGVAEGLMGRCGVARVEKAIKEIDSPDGEAERPSVVSGNWLEIFRDEAMPDDGDNWGIEAEKVWPGPKRSRVEGLRVYAFRLS